MAELAPLQSWMQSAIFSGGAAGGAEAFVAGDARLGPAARVAIYARGYRARLLETLRGEYPALRRFGGDTAFDLFASSYIARHPSRRPSLYDFGARFADHLAEVAPPAAAEPGSAMAIPAQLARLERARAEALRAQGVEAGQMPVTADFALVPGARLIVPPAVRLLRLGFDFSALLAAVDKGEEPPIPATAETLVAVARSGWRVRTLTLDERRFRFLETLPAVDGEVHAAAAAAARATGGETGGFIAELAHWLPAAGAAGLVARC